MRSLCQALGNEGATIREKKKKNNSCRRDPCVLVGGEKKQNKEVRSLESGVDGGGKGPRKRGRRAGNGNGRSVSPLIGGPRKSLPRRSDGSEGGGRGEGPAALVVRSSADADGPLGTAFLC